MGWLKGLSKLARSVASPVLSTARAINRVPVVGTALKAVPGVGTALTIAGGAAALSSAFSGGGGSSLPALPMSAAGGLPALPGTAGANPIVGDRGIFQNDPNIVAALQPFAISKTNLRQYYRSPIKGFVIRYDSAGDPYAIPKTLARKYLGWKPSKKPPISVGEFQALKRADRTAKKVKKILAMTTRVDRNVGKGGKVVVRKKRS